MRHFWGTMKVFLTLSYTLQSPQSTQLLLQLLLACWHNVPMALPGPLDIMRSLWHQEVPKLSLGACGIVGALWGPCGIGCSDL